MHALLECWYLIVLLKNWKTTSIINRLKLRKNKIPFHSPFLLKKSLTPSRSFPPHRHSQIFSLSSVSPSPTGYSHSDHFSRVKHEVTKQAYINILKWTGSHAPTYLGWPEGIVWKDGEKLSKIFSANDRNMSRIKNC